MSALLSRGSMLLFGMAMVGWFSLDRLVGSGDGDNPALSVAFIRDNPRHYVWSGLLLWVMAISLTVAVLTVSELLAPLLDGAIPRRAVSMIGLFSAGFFLLLGAIQVSTPGTLVYIADLDKDWGEAAYLAVQMIGLQGLGTGGILALSFWAVGLSWLNLEARLVSRAVSWTGILPALLVTMGVIGPLGLGPDVLYPCMPCLW